MVLSLITAGPVYGCKGGGVQLKGLWRPAPAEVRIAGAVISVVGLAAVVFALVLVGGLIAGMTTGGASAVLAEAVYYLVLGAGIGVCGGGLTLGHTWARTPSLVLGLIVALLGWYMTGPSDRPWIGVPVIVAGAVVVVLLFRRASQIWAESERGD